MMTFHVGTVLWLWILVVPFLGMILEAIRANRDAPNRHAEVPQSVREPRPIATSV